MDEKPNRLFHGTARALGALIEKEGLNPEGMKGMGPAGKCPYSEKGYVYFTNSMKMARMFACGMANKVHLGNKGQIFEAKNIKVEIDPLLTATSFRHRGIVPSDKIESIEILDCDKWNKENESLIKLMGND